MCGRHSSCLFHFFLPELFHCVFDIAEMDLSIKSLYLFHLNDMKVLMWICIYLFWYFAGATTLLHTLYFLIHNASFVKCAALLLADLSVFEIGHVLESSPCLYENPCWIIILITSICDQVASLHLLRLVKPVQASGKRVEVIYIF